MKGTNEKSNSPMKGHIVFEKRLNNRVIENGYRLIFFYERNLLWRFLLDERNSFVEISSLISLLFP